MRGFGSAAQYYRLIGQIIGILIAGGYHGLHRFVYVDDAFNDRASI